MQMFINEVFIFMDTKDNLIKVQKEYISLLEKECSRLGGLMIVRPYLRPKQEDIDLGQNLRDRISELENELSNSVS